MWGPTRLSKGDFQSGASGGNQQTGLSASVAAQFRDASAGGRHGRADGAGVDGASECLDDGKVSACDAKAGLVDQESAGWA